jgi:hypothetical protein
MRSQLARLGEFRHLSHLPVAKYPHKHQTVCKSSFDVPGTSGSCGGIHSFTMPTLVPLGQLSYRRMVSGTPLSLFIKHWDATDDGASSFMRKRQPDAAFG